jgi:hypothetical protein
MFDRLHAEGKLGKAWNKGLTSETDGRVADYGIKRSAAFTEDERKRASLRMKKGRLSGEIRTLRGSEHSQWRGGTSPLLSICHANKKLFDFWKYPKLVASGFRCENCGSGRDDDPRAELEVHHSHAKMATIVKFVAEEFGWSDYYALSPETDEETIKIKYQISEGVVNFHLANNIRGVVLCKICHKDSHPKHNL